MRQTVLIVEDDPDIRALLSFNLQKEGYAVLEAEDGRQGVDTAIARRPDLILLDVMMPIMDGLEALRILQRHSGVSSIPVIVLTARGEELDRVVGLELGADDYVVKPFSIRELMLRIRAILRRQSQAQVQDSLSLGGVVLDSSAHQVLVQGQDIDLTATEFRLLEDLMRHAGTVRTREQLLDSVWGYSFEGYARTVDTHVRRLRGKLGEAAEFVDTVRGVGYRFKG